ncbi:MAG: hypothetical protein Q7U85_06085 [Rhodocyclaceae bacterium]|nr:hypothetical protein [Rhodocyclaceae bacterium]
MKNPAVYHCRMRFLPILLFLLFPVLAHAFDGLVVSVTGAAVGMATIKNNL